MNYNSLLKICTICNCRLPITAFYSKSARCKECHKIKVTENYFKKKKRTRIRIANSDTHRWCPSCKKVNL